MSVNKYEKFGSRGFAPSSNTVGNAEGDIVFIGGGGGEGTNVTAGRIYYLNSSTQWTMADADGVSTSSNLLAVALGSGDPSTVGMLLRGMVTLSVDPGVGVGIPLYLHINAGQATRVAPSGVGDVVRVIGYKIGSSTNKQIWFNPDNTWVVIAE
jgi:hypothetical protein